MRTLYKHGEYLALWLAVAGLASVLSTAPVHAQDANNGSSRASPAEQYRTSTVDAWHWKPNSGVALTTTEYAIEYVTGRYITDDSTFPGKTIEHDGARLRIDSLDAGVVLFQTADLDVIVLHRDAVEGFLGEGPPVVIVDRRDKRVIFAELGQRPCPSTFEFIDVNGEQPLEVLQRRDCATAGGGGGWSAAVHRLDTSFDELISIRGAFVPSNCPRLQVSSGSISARQGHGVRVELAHNIALSDDDGTCHFLRPTDPARVMRQCQWSATSSLSKCEDRVQKTQTVDTDALRPRMTPENARFLVENMDRLRRGGFEFTSEAREILREAAASKSN